MGLLCTIEPELQSILAPAVRRLPPLNLLTAPTPSAKHAKHKLPYPTIRQTAAQSAQPAPLRAQKVPLPAVRIMHRCLRQVNRICHQILGLLSTHTLRTSTTTCRYQPKHPKQHRQHGAPRHMCNHRHPPCRLPTLCQPMSCWAQASSSCEAYEPPSRWMH